MIYIWIRRTCDWNDEEAFLAQVDERFEDRLALWNETFAMPYHRFRARVFEIAQDNLAQVRGATVAEWDEIPEGALVMPTDDDDWFAPHAAETLERVQRPGIQAYVWEPTFAETPMWFGHRVYLARRRLIPWWAPRWSCSTNTYAMPKSDHNLAALEFHGTASERVDTAAPGEVLTLPDRISVINRTIASRTQLGAGDRKHPSTKAEMLRKHARYRRRYRRLDLSRTPWAEPYVARMAELTEELEPRG
jgi:hypothetical protein